MSLRIPTGLTGLWSTSGTARVFAARYLASGATLLASAIAQFCLFILLARAFGVEQFGQFVVITAITTLAASCCGVGAGDVAVRLLARDVNRYPEAIGHGSILIAASGVPLIALSMLVLMALSWPAATEFRSVVTLLNLCISNVALFGFVSLTERIFIGRRDFWRANLVNAGYAYGRLATGVVAWLGFGLHDIYSWALWNTATHVLIVGLCIWMLRPLGAPMWRVNWRELRLGFHFTTPYVVDALRQNVDRITLSLVAAPDIIGNYGATSRLVQSSQVVVSSMNRVVYPHLAGKAHLGGSAIVRMAIRYTKFVSLAALAVATGIFLVAPALPALMGADYTPVIGYVQLLCWVIVPLALQTVPYDALGALDRHPERARVYNIFSVVGILATIMLTWAFGVLGAFCAAYLTQIALAAALWVTLLRLRGES